MNPLERVPDWLSAFCTTTFHRPKAAPLVSMVQVICVELTTVTPVAMMSDCPAFVSRTEAPLLKLVPVRLVIDTLEFTRPDTGVMPVTVGAGQFTV
ncbi:MAG TPA: hypothetical protein PK573_17195, partial [Spirochaetota bacterium]|nr:hypothetical protein [Spirochaetota bacterium]